MHWIGGYFADFLRASLHGCNFSELVLLQPVLPRSGSASALGTNSGPSPIVTPWTYKQSKTIASMGLNSSRGDRVYSSGSQLWSQQPARRCFPRLHELNLWWTDADPSQQNLWWLHYSNTHGLQKSCGNKGAVWPLSKLERGPLIPAWTGFYCFSGHITLRVIFIYHAQVHHRWLPFKNDKGQNTANYFKEKEVTAQGERCSHSIRGRFSTDFRKMKILGKHLLPQFREQEQVRKF